MCTTHKLSRWSCKTCRVHRLSEQCEGVFMCLWFPALSGPGSVADGSGGGGEGCAGEGSKASGGSKTIWLNHIERGGKEFYPCVF